MLGDWHTVWNLLATVPHHEGEAHEAHSMFGELAAVGPFAVAQFVVLVGGGALQLTWLMRDLQRRVNVAALDQMVKKLVAADNVDRAIKLCGANPAPASLLLRVGLEALREKRDPRQAMHAALPNYMKIIRSGFVGTMLFGAFAFAEGVSLLVRGMSKGVGEQFSTLMVISLAIVGGLTAWNFIRAGSLQRELEYICELLDR